MTILRLVVAAALVVCLSQAAARAQVSEVPTRDPLNLIVASYNIKWLGQTPHNLNKLAEVIQHFDICGVIEIKNERPLAELANELEKLTGEDWGHAFGMRTHRPAGRYHEAYGVLWRRDRAPLGDGIVSGVWDLKEEFRNDPYIVSFASGSIDFSIVLIHTRWSNDPEGTRAGEVKAIAEHINHMQGFLAEQDILVAGDFNYSADSRKMKPLTEIAELVQISDGDLSTFKTEGDGFSESYDHMFATESFADLIVGPARTLDVSTLIYGDQDPANMKKARSELSDHLPVFVVLNR